jgi:hypothetical protein
MVNAGNYFIAITLDFPRLVPGIREHFVLQGMRSILCCVFGLLACYYVHGPCGAGGADSDGPSSPPRMSPAAARGTIVLIYLNRSSRISHYRQPSLHRQIYQSCLDVANGE